MPRLRPRGPGAPPRLPAGPVPQEMEVRVDQVAPVTSARQGARDLRGLVGMLDDQNAAWRNRTPRSARRLLDNAVAASIRDPEGGTAADLRALASRIAERFQRSGDISADDPWPAGQEHLLADRLLWAMHIVAMDLIHHSSEESEHRLVRAAVGFYRRVVKGLRRDGLGSRGLQMAVGEAIPHLLHAVGMTKPEPEPEFSDDYY